MKLEIIYGGMIDSNAYLICDNGEAVLIDCGINYEMIKSALEKNQAKLKYVILTHGHIDHIAGLKGVKEETGAKVLIHKNDGDSLTDGNVNLSSLFMKGFTFEPADRFVTDGEVISVGDAKLKIIHTPGHSPGGICILCGDNVFTGDTLFKGSVGRTDFSGGDHNQLITSINNALMVLKDEYRVYPGHGMSSTIGQERISNPFIN